MNAFLKWTGILAGVGLAGTFAYRAVDAGRRRLKTAVGRAEAVAGRTRAALEETEAALHETRNAL